MPAWWVGKMYREKDPDNNKSLKLKLFKEQFQFCAYSEKRCESAISYDVEHFNPTIKYKDDYYNYYAVLRQYNLQKGKKKYIHDTSFFQNPEEFQKRIHLVRDDNYVVLYDSVDENDQEALDLIELLGFNHPDLALERKKRLNRLKFISNSIDLTSYLFNFPEDLDFISSIEFVFSMDLSKFLQADETES